MKALKRIGIYAAVILLAAVLVTPLLWAASTSLKADNKLYLDPPQLIPNPAVFSNYLTAFRMAPFAVYFRNTIVITVLAGIGRVLASSFVAYGFARFSFPGRDFFFTCLLATMMVPSMVVLVPQFLMFNAIGWVNTFKPLIVPLYFGGASFMIFLGRQFIRTIPLELDQAAEIDGCGAVRTLASVVLPNCRPFLATATILSFQHDWNNFLAPLVYLQSENKYTLALGMRYLAALGGGDSMAGRPVDHYVMAATLIISLPIIAVFLTFQRYFVRGVVMSGLKG